MKTLKLIIAGIAIATLAYSCSNDRDDEARQKAIEEVKNSNQSKIKLNQKGGFNSHGKENTGKIGDTIKSNTSSNSSGAIPPNKTLGTDDGDEVVDPTKPDKPW